MAGMAGLFIISLPLNVFAAQIIFKVVPNNVTGDRATIVEARIDPQSKDLNVVEGIVNFQGTITDKLSVEVDADGSVLTIWPTPPQYLSSEKVIRFTGGVPGGFNHESLLFRMRLSSPLSGNIIISWIDGAAYLSDGLGTKETISTMSVTVNLGVSRYDYIKKVIIILLIVIIMFVVFRHVYKKIIKK